MTIDNKLSVQIEQQFPDVFKEDGQNLIAFVKAYYEWMESTGQVLDVNRSLKDYRDIDLTLDAYLKFFQDEVMSQIPETTSVDKRLLAKRIKDLYTAKGSQLSYELMFRILYNEDITFYYPGEDILRASDGRWVKNFILNVIIQSGTPEDFISQIITGQTSGATATVESVTTTLSSGIEVTELNLTGIIGTFEDGEIVRTGTGFNAEVFNTIGPLNDVSPIIEGGRNHQIGDNVLFQAPVGQGALGTVANTSDTTSIEVYVINGGSGYQQNAIINITGGSGAGASARIGSLSNTETILLNRDIILPMANVVFGTAPLFVSLGANTTAVSANLAAANAGTTLIAGLNYQNTVVGSISTIAMDTYGFGYDTALPNASVIDFDVQRAHLIDPLEFPPDYKGTDADLGTRYVDGAITDVTIPVTTQGTGYRKFDLITIINQSRLGTSNAIGNPNITGVIEQEGQYTDTKGFLSWNNKLQDNFYYQEYSYVIQSTQFIDTYRSVVNNILHPAGVKLFGEYDIHTAVDVTATAETDVQSTIELQESLGTKFDATTNTFDYNEAGITFDRI
jgi:hypothetical protein